MVFSEFIGSISAAIGIGKWVNKLINPDPEVRYVHMKYPEEIGLTKDFKEKGLKLSWCDERKLQIQLENEGAKHIFIPPNESKPVIFKVKNSPRDQVLIYKKET